MTDAGPPSPPSRPPPVTTDAEIVPPPATPPPSSPPMTPATSHGADYDAEVRAPEDRAFQRGEASYYHDALAGRSTASGAPYDPQRLTAAHRTLDFGTVVDVVRDDGRWVRVTINDRGPFHRGRIIDLSRRAAERIGLVRRGVAPVRLFLPRGRPP
ncbi:MAG: septal ring lytic transglycosylase RlpA family protein [Myxococcota bacterium]